MSDSWVRAATCLRLLNAAPGYLGGAVVRMRSGPERDLIMDGLRGLRARKLHPAVSDEHLFGGLDLSATLQSGQYVKTSGVYATPCTVILTMAERCAPDLAAKIAHQIDRDAGHCLIALDEGAEPQEAAPLALADRVPFHIAPESRPPAGWTPDPPSQNACDPRRVSASPDDAATLAVLAAQFGIDSLRAPLLALRVARTHAAIAGRSAVTQADLQQAAGLVYPQRATQVPQDAEDTPPAEPDAAQAQANDGAQDPLDIPQGDMLVDAVRALLPADLLAGVGAAGGARNAGGAGAGQKRTGNRRGRPLPSRPGKLDGRNRIDLVATLRVAAPWQPMRQRTQPNAKGLLIRPSDIRVKRYQDQSDRVLIFAVDASGSAAVSRLNEAKGAVELLLTQAYAARDHVALVTFRGTQADLLLPPTRSLVQTKRRLAGLPGGGGTPLATGLQHAAQLAMQSRAKGLTPTLVVLTDGRANIALDGSADRARAASDADTVARMVRAQGIDAVLIDTGKRPHAALQALSVQLGGQYMPLPRADARTLTGAVSAALAQ